MAGEEDTKARINWALRQTGDLTTDALGGNDDDEV